MTFTTRFAPSPTGPLHLGHAYSAMLAHDMARAAGGRFLLRIEDIDTTRARPEWEQAIYDDLEWLGLRWDAAPVRQSDRLADYHAALERLWDQGVLYPCTCRRKDILAALDAPQEGAPMGPDGLIYPGTCRHSARRVGNIPTGETLRLDLRTVLSRMGQNTLGFTETGVPEGEKPGDVLYKTEALLNNLGDIVLSRRDFVGSYHLSVVLDDAAQNVTHVVRGADLFEATQIHVILQKLLGLPTPIYHHHRLIRDDAGKRLAKRDDARAIARYRADGVTPQEIRAMTGL